MQAMSQSTVETADLLDLKLLPAWVKEPAEPRSYAGYTAEESRWQKTGHGPPRDRPKRRTSNTQRPRQTGAITRHREIRAPFPVLRTAPKIAARWIGIFLRRERCR